jgi:hypothetical protein
METKYYYENTSRNDGHCIEMELRDEEPRLVFRPVQGKPLIWNMLWLIIPNALLQPV